MTADPRDVGRAIAASADEAVRLWRTTRRHARPEVFPGMLDGLVEPFARAVGDTLSEGRPAGDVWDRVEGVARLPLSGGGDDVEAEWVLAGEVVAAIADALKACPEARTHAIEAAREAWTRTIGLAEARGPMRGKVLVVRVLADGAPRR